MARTINTNKVMVTRNKEEMTFNERLEAVGVNTLYPDGFNHDTITNWNMVKVELEYQGKVILRPNVSAVVRVVKEQFNLDM
jgi:hypothetical protein